MIVQPSHDLQKIPNSLAWKNKLSIAQKYMQISSQQKNHSPSRKGTLSTLVETVNLDFFSLMKPSASNTQISQKLTQPVIHEEQLESEEVEALKSVSSNRLTPQKSVQEVLQKGKNRNTSSNIKSTQLYLKFLIDQKAKTDQQENCFFQQTKAQNEASINPNVKMIKMDQTDQVTLISKNGQKSSQKLIKQIKIKKLEVVCQSTGESSFEDERQLFMSDERQSLKIEDFQEIKMLGEGVYGRVSLARHKKTNLLVAIKRIAKNNLNQEDSIYLAREIKIQTFSEHPNIVQLYSFFHDSQYIYLILQVCNEGNLYSIMQNNRGRLPEEKVKKYIRQICTAVQFLHNNEIIHRDIKPENILVHNGVAKICDFGWAVHAPELRSTLCGTPLYSSPELIKNQKYDIKIDIWNIGVLTYELICGKTPFDIKIREDLAKIVDTQAEYPVDGSMSSACISFIKGCLQKNPKDRFEVWELLRHPFINIEQKLRESLRVMWGQGRN